MVGFPLTGSYNGQLMCNCFAAINILILSNRLIDSMLNKMIRYKYACIVILNLWALLDSQAQVARSRHYTYAIFTENGDTAFLNETNVGWDSLIGLPDLAVSPHKQHIRLRMVNFALDIWKDSGRWKGIVVYYYEESCELNGKYGRIYYDRRILTDSVMQELGILVDSVGIFNIDFPMNVGENRFADDHGDNIYVELSDSLNYYSLYYGIARHDDTIGKSTEFLVSTARSILVWHNAGSNFDEVKPFYCFEGRMPYGVSMPAWKKRRIDRLRRHQVHRYKQGKPIEPGYLVYQRRMITVLLNRFY